MDYICEVCDRSIIQDPSEYQYYLTNGHRKNNKKLYMQYTIKNINFDELDKVLNDYVATLNKKFDFYLFSCKLIIELDNNLTEKIKTNYFYNTNINDIKRNLLYNIYNSIPRIFKNPYNSCNIKQMIVKTIDGKCNMTYEHYMNQPMSMVERQIIFNNAKNPELLNTLDRTKNHPLIRKNSKVVFNN